MTKAINIFDYMECQSQVKSFIYLILAYFEYCRRKTTLNSIEKYVKIIDNAEKQTMYR